MRKPNPLEYTSATEYDKALYEFIAERIAWRMGDCDRIKHSRSIVSILAFDLLGLSWRNAIQKYGEGAQVGENA